jgi:hypothetical protein
MTYSLTVHFEIKSGRMLPSLLLGEGFYHVAKTARRELIG